MKIVGLEEFRKLPEGTIFMKFEPCTFEELGIKGETWEYDFLYCDLLTQIESSGSEEECLLLSDADNDSSISLKLDLEGYGRDGCFEDNQKFAIYEKQDIENLITKLSHCLIKAY